MWNITSTKHVSLTGKAVCGLAPTTDGMIAVGYREGGVDVFDADGSFTNVLSDHHLSGISALCDGRFVVRSEQNDIFLYSADWEKLDVEFDKLGWLFANGGLGSDQNNHIYVACQAVEVIRVYRPRGGTPYRQILCRGLSISDVQVMTNGYVVVTSHESSVKVLEEVEGEAEVRHEITKEGARVYPALLGDNMMLIGWVRDGALNVDLYTDHLEYVRTLLTGFAIEGNEPGKLRALASSTAGVVFSTQNHLFIFQLS